MSGKLLRFCANISISSRNNGFCCKHKNLSHSLRWFSSPSGSTEISHSKDVGSLFIQEDVQSILQRLTGFNLDKIFHNRPTSEFSAPKYELMTDIQLEEVTKEFVAMGQERLQMPPVVESWGDEYEVLSDDPEIANFSSHDVVFTDVTFGVSNKKRTVVIRESSGLLRTARQSEHDAVEQLYFPEEGRMYQTPRMFEAQQLEQVLSTHRYEYILDRACVQFEPNNPEFQRVTQRAYEHVNTTGMYEALRSTRHFGGMAFYFATHKNIDGLLKHLLNAQSIGDASDLVLLYQTVHPDCKSANQTPADVTNRARVEAYIQHESVDSGPLELALQVLDEKSAPLS